MLGSHFGARKFLFLEGGGLNLFLSTDGSEYVATISLSSHLMGRSGLVISQKDKIRTTSGAPVILHILLARYCPGFTRTSNCGPEKRWLLMPLRIVLSSVLSPTSKSNCGNKNVCPVGSELSS